MTTSTPSRTFIQHIPPRAASPHPYSRLSYSPLIVLLFPASVFSPRTLCFVVPLFVIDPYPMLSDSPYSCWNCFAIHLIHLPPAGILQKVVD